MDRKKVTSSNIESVGYDPSTKQMHVEFRGGSIYNHDDVSQETYDALMSSESKGAHYHKAIKGKFKVQRLDGKA
jgi:hypothetical protein